MRLLLVEDDPLVGDALESLLSGEGYAVDWMVDASGAQAAFETAPYALGVLDVALPDGSGLELVERFKRQNPDVGLLLLTARDSVEDRVAGLDGGADDYLTKPFEFQELLARLRALRRRSGQSSCSAALVCGSVRLDVAQRRLTRNGVPVEVGRRELAVLEIMLEHQGRVLSRAFIQEQIYGWSDEVHSNTVEVYVHNLRRRLGTDFIRTVRGVGYVIDERPGAR